MNNNYYIRRRIDGDMATKRVFKEHTIALESIDHPEFYGHRVVMNYGCIMICKAGYSILQVNNECIRQEKDSVTVFYPGNIVESKETSTDYEVDVLVFPESLMHDAACQLEPYIFTLMRRNFYIQSDVILHIIRPIQLKMLDRAVKDATDKAKIMAEAAGCKLGSVINIDYGYRELHVYSEARNIHSNSEAMACDSNSLDISPDDLAMSDNVKVEWELVNVLK